MRLRHQMCKRLNRPETIWKSIITHAKDKHHYFSLLLLKCAFLSHAVNMRQSRAFDIERNTPLYVTGASPESTNIQYVAIDIECTITLMKIK